MEVRTRFKSRLDSSSRFSQSMRKLASKKNLKRAVIAGAVAGGVGSLVGGLVSRMKKGDLGQQLKKGEKILEKISIMVLSLVRCVLFRRARRRAAAAARAAQASAQKLGIFFV